MAWPNVFCWSKIGPEAGLALQQILRWKELQRSLCDDVFFWGVGGTPSKEKQSAFFASAAKPQVLFCKQAGKAKLEYEQPSSTLLWTHYINDRGREVAMPEYAAVTSKGGSPIHFAIIARADVPLHLRDDIGFDIGMFRNFRGSENIAFQQTAPLVERNPEGKPRKLYNKGFWATLLSFAVLTRPRALSLSETASIRQMMSSDRANPEDFKGLIRKLKVPT